MSRDVLQDGLLQGRLPGKKEFCLYYVELTTSQFHIFDGQDGEMRKHLHSIKIRSSDMSGVETKVRKGEFRFFFSNSKEGRYIFKVSSEVDRENWISKFLRVINKEGLEKIEGFRTPTLDAFNPDNVGSSPSVPTKFDVPAVPFLPTARGGKASNSRTLPGRGRLSTGNATTVLKSSLPPVPGGGPPKPMAVSPRASIISTDSGIGTSVGGEVRRPSMHQQGGSKSTPNSGSAMFSRDDSGSSSSSGSGSLSHNQSHSHSADSEFRHRVKVTDEGTPKWFWGTLSRQDCEDKLRGDGEMGNFIVRVNATGHYIMSFWRIDGIHHHKILNHEGIWRFEKAAVNAEGESLADLLDTYMKNCSKDRNIKPFGGGLFENYTYAWTPQEFDMDLLGKKLKEQKMKREQARKPRKRQEYTPVEMDSGMNTEEGFENDPQPPRGSKEKAIKIKSTKEKPLPAPPTNKKPPSHARTDPPSPKSPMTPKRVAPGPPSAKANKKQGPTAPLKPNGSSSTSNFARLQEIAKLSYPGQAPSPQLSATQGSLSPGEQEDLGEEMEPMYANSADASTSQDPLMDSGDGYQNWEFNGPPKPSEAAGPASQKASLKPSAPVASTAADDDNQYQNVNFQTAKSAKKNPTKSSLRPSTKASPRPSTKASPHPSTKASPHPSTKASPRPNSKSSQQSQKQQQAAVPQTNASAYSDDASVYQNVGFKTRR